MEDGHSSLAEDFRVARASSPENEEGKSDGGKVKVLVVDDEPESLINGAEVLRSGGFNALSASSGSEALNILRSEPDIRMLFTDILMRGMDGVTLGRKARKLVPGIQVVLVSLLPTFAMEAHSGEPGEFPFLMKPFLMSEVRLLLGRQSAFFK